MSLFDGFRKRHASENEPEPAPVEPALATQELPAETMAEVSGEPSYDAPEGPAEAERSSASEVAGGDPSDEDLHDEVVTILKTVYDPEIPVDIYELGLIYEVDVRDENAVYVQMTLTSPMCPVAESLPIEVEAKVRSVARVSDVELELVWEPPWSMDMMSEAAKLELNIL